MLVFITVSDKLLICVFSKFAKCKALLYPDN